MQRALGVCYYPEHWPEEIWARDAAQMVDLGIGYVRVGEFAWGVIEPEPGQLHWDWLDRAIDTLADAGLQIVLGTPTATPPRWMLDKHPDMLAWDAEGRPRGFGSRRHYCHSHAGYLDEACRITQLMAERYGRHPALALWQTDNEYGCHDTVISYSPAARAAFQVWLERRYGSIEALNAAWGNVFWSMQYQRFDQIGLPHLTVTEGNPAHGLDFRRFSSDQVLVWNQAQVDILRAHSDVPISHNYMGRVTEFDHHALGDQMEVATWDSYPLGFLDEGRSAADEDTRRAFARQGDPDFQAFHHDLYRGVSQGRWWVMEQQPGPVNWAPHNPAPLPGMVRLWTWEAFAHGAETVTYFRWRQAPFGQEQFHAGLLRPDSGRAPGYDEAAEVAAELATAPEVSFARAPVALIFDYTAEWACMVKPQGQGLRYFDLVFQTYQALRRLGLSVDILPARNLDFSAYAAIFAPGLCTVPAAFAAAVAGAPGQVVFGPRTGSVTAGYAIPDSLPPDVPGWDLTVSHVETLRPDGPRPLEGGGAAGLWVEHIEGGAPLMTTEDGAAVAVRCGPRQVYLGGWLDGDAMARLVRLVLADSDVPLLDLPPGVRARETATERFWFNYGADAVRYDGRDLPAAGVLREALE